MHAMAENMWMNRGTWSMRNITYIWTREWILRQQTQEWAGFLKSRNDLNLSRLLISSSNHLSYLTRNQSENSDILFWYLPHLSSHTEPRPHFRIRVSWLCRVLEPSDVLEDLEANERLFWLHPIPWMALLRRNGSLKSGNSRCSLRRSVPVLQWRPLAFRNYWGDYTVTK